MPIIDSKSDSKFDALIRVNKADSLMSFIMATSNVKTESNRKAEVAKRLKSAYELFRENIRNSSSGAGSYGDGSRDILEQFDSHYTMGYEMGIWYDSDYHLNPLAIKVSKYEMTVSEYIGVVFLNLFSYFKKDGEDVYHHFLYEILKRGMIESSLYCDISKGMIAETLPIDKATEQANLIFNYLVDTDLFVQVDTNTMRLSEKWIKKEQTLLNLCNLEYKNLSFEEAKERFKDKKFYSDYVTKLPKQSISEITDLQQNNANYVEDGTFEYSVSNINECERIQNGTNILLYGVPGSGKSWTIEHEYCEPGTHVERLVFHPDYTNADFIGQILPVVDEDKQVTYEFVAGPFTNILRDAYHNPDRKYVLIIEEINRGNAPAIFGDIFQLLDRMVENKTLDGTTYNVGTSEYSITNENIAKWVYGSPTHKVRIPSNLSILGTMNTSDQNVFTLDTAFQRRWQMRLIENNFDNVRTSLANAPILDTDITWKHFCETINKIIIGNKAKMASAEDKRLGVYFVHERDLKFDEGAIPSDESVTLLTEYNNLLSLERLEKISTEQASRLREIRKAVLHNRLFPEKVIKYLWDDAFKFNSEALFDTDSMDSLEKVIRTFVFSKGQDRCRIFRQSVREALYPNQQQ